MAQTKRILKEIKLENIVVRRNVRTGINHAWVTQLSKYYLNKEDIEPIVVSPIEDGLYEVVKGRHRLQARKLADFPTITAYISPQDNEVDLIMEAVGDDVKGNSPMTDEDFVFVAKQLLELTGSRRQVVIALSKKISNKLAQEYASTAVSSKERKALSKAMDMLAKEDITIKQAAEISGVDVEKLRNKVRTKNKTAKVKGVSLRDLKANISTSHSAFVRVYQKTFNQIEVAYENNLANSSDVNALLDGAEGLANNFLKRIEEQRERFNLAIK